MKNREKTKQIEVPAPYSSEYIASQLKLCLLPLLKMENVVKKYSPIVVEFVEIDDYYKCYYDNMYTEWRLFNKVHLQTYINSFRSIHDNSTLLIGQMILKEHLDIPDIDKFISNIKQDLDNMYEIGVCIEEWIFDTPKLDNTDDYLELSKTINTAKSNFDIFYKNYQKSHKNIEKINLNNLDFNIKKYEVKLISLYKYLLIFASYALQLASEHKLHLYKYVLADFSRNLAKILFWSAGNFYLEINSCKDIELKIERNITRCFNNLEINSYKNIPSVKDIFDFLLHNNELAKEEVDNKILNIYQQLKNEINVAELCELK